MTILFHCPWHNNQEWLTGIKKKFIKDKIFTIEDNPDYSKIERKIFLLLLEPHSLCYLDVRVRHRCY